MVIDRLDENWIEERLRYLMIRALIETVRDFCKVRHAKIIIALRRDLMDRVIGLSRGPGFQEEKYESLYMDLDWSREQLTRILDKRISRLVKQTYTKQAVTHKDLLPERVDGQPAIDYLLDRTLMRPRDVIVFFNACIRCARGKPDITVAMLKEAEGEYSRLRLRSLADEWIADYPHLLRFADLLKGMPASFAVRDVNEDRCLDLAIQLLDAGDEVRGELADVLRGVDNDPERISSFRTWLVAVFYRVGMVGLKLETFEATVWSSSGRRSVSAAEITCSTRVAVHPCFYRSLGINSRAK